jgi:hypothetical protein
LHGIDAGHEDINELAAYGQTVADEKREAGATASVTLSIMKKNAASYFQTVSTLLVGLVSNCC